MHEHYDYNDVYDDDLYNLNDMRAMWKTISIIPHFSGMLSMIGSSAILYDIIKTGEVWKQCQLRILMGMSFIDLFTSTAFFLGVWATPKDPDYSVSEYFGVNVYGNDYTCRFQAYLITLKYSNLLYSLCLAIVYVLIVNYNKEEQWLKHKVESLMHTICLCYGLLLAQYMLVYEKHTTTDINIWCSPSIFDSEQVIQWLYLGSILIVTVLITISMFVLYSGVLYQEKMEQQRMEQQRNDGLVSTSFERTPFRKLAYQCIAFTGAFYLCYLPLLLFSYTDFGTEVWSEDWFTTMVLIAFFLPSQGFFTALVYFGPEFTKRFPNQNGLWQATSTGASVSV